VAADELVAIDLGHKIQKTWKREIENFPTINIHFFGIWVGTCVSQNRLRTKQQRPQHGKPVTPHKTPP
jgi:hypothetical protein